MTIRVGIDMVSVERMTESLQAFGDRFLRRIFTAQEIHYAQAAPLLSAERLAARFAAKESAMKALRLTDIGPCWKELEVQREPGGACSLVVHGAAKQTIEAAGVREVTLSLSHEGGFAVAVVVARSEIAPSSSSE